MHSRIICIGNRLFSPDSAGPLVYDILNQMPLPPETELIDGGLAGLNLLCFLEQTDRVLFVDAISGFTATDGVVLIDPLRDLQLEEGFDHNSGLAYLLQVAPEVLASPLPSMLLVGIEGVPQPRYCLEAAAHCLRLVSGSEHEAAGAIDLNQEWSQL